MPAQVKQDKQALDWVINNPTDPRAPQITQKLGLAPQDVQAWDYANKNPDDGRSNLLKNKVFEKIAQSRPAADEQGASNLDRFLIKNLVDNEPKVQETYFKRKGFDTRIVDGEVEIKKPEDTVFSKIEPSGLDLWDVTDIAGDVLEGVADAVITSGKVLGALGAPFTGGGSLAAASAAGAGVSGGIETGRQFLGKRMGLRDEVNESKILQSAALGATIPGAAKVGGAALKKTSKGISWIAKKAAGMIDDAGEVLLKPNAEAVKEAFKDIGGKATDGHIFKSKLVEEGQSALSKLSGTFGGMFDRRALV